MLHGLVCGPVAEAKIYSVFILAGQSNMAGRGMVSELPQELTEPAEGVMIFHGNNTVDNVSVDGRGTWETLGPGHGMGFSSDGVTSTHATKFGPELTFGRELHRLLPGTNIALIKYAQGGSSLSCAYPTIFGCWDAEYDSGGGQWPDINQFDHLVATINNALSSDDIDSDGESDILIPKGIVWMQGESDAGTAEDVALAYRQNLQRFMASLRATVQETTLPAVIGLISDSGQDADGIYWQYGTIVRERQIDFVCGDQDSLLVTDTDDYAYADPAHYDSAGYRDLGLKFARAMAQNYDPGLYGGADGFNSARHFDADSDGIPDVCDSCAGERDFDHDGVCDSKDNCPSTPNQDQLDLDADTVGDACDAAPGKESRAAMSDAPHNAASGIGCGECHSYSLWWQYAPMSAGSPEYGSITDAVCAKCHTHASHASAAMGDSHRAALGSWSTNCVDCHGPHSQGQLEWSPSSAADLYLVSGTMSGPLATVDQRTTFTYTLDAPPREGWSDPATWADKNGSVPPRGLILVADTQGARETFQVVAATADTITVKGTLAPALSDRPFALIYGQLIKSDLRTANVSRRPVKFFNPKSSVQGYTANDAPVTGVCQVCHTATLYWRDDGTGADHHPGEICTGCHRMAMGFGVCTVAAPEVLTVPAASADGLYTVSWSPSASAGVTYVLEEATDNTFATDLREIYRGPGLDAEMSKEEVNSGTTFYYRIRAIKSNCVDSDWTPASQGCQVLFPLAAPTALVLPATSADDHYTVSWGASSAPGVSYVLQEATDQGFTADVRSVDLGTALSTAIAKGETESGTTFYYRVKAVKDNYGDSPWLTTSDTSGCLVLFSVAAPGAITVPAGDMDGTYGVAWGASATADARYTLEEATDPLFGAGQRQVYAGQAVATTISGRQPGVRYYYRVRASKDNYSDSAWMQGANGCLVIITDRDDDGVSAHQDNCPATANADQADSDADGLGDACDSSPNAAHFGSTMDAPHNDSHGIGCQDCHSYSLWWQNSPLRAASADYNTTMDAICAKCHGAGWGGIAEAHASSAMGNAHRLALGDWQTHCVDCHEPHRQAQLNWRGSDPQALYLVQGTIDGPLTVAAGQTTLHYRLDELPEPNYPEWSDVATWENKSAHNLSTGLILVEDRANALNTYEVLAATADTITVKGGMGSDSAGRTFGLIYGGLIRSSIGTPSSTGRTVKFFSNGIGGYTNNDQPVSGICQVCHANTLYWQEDGGGNGHYPLTPCSDCHAPIQGFAPQ